MKSARLYETLAMHVQSRLIYKNSGYDEGAAKYTQEIRQLVETHLSQDGCFDAETWLDLDKSTPEKLVFHNGWDHRVTVTPSLCAGIRLNVTGSGTPERKGDIAEAFWLSLWIEVPVAEFEAEEAA